MVEVKLHHLSVGIPSNGYTSQLLFERMNFRAHCQCCTCRPCIYEFRQGRRSMKIKGLRVGSEGWYTFLEVAEVREKRMSMISKSVMNADMHATPCKIARTEYVYLSDNQSVSTPEGKEGVHEMLNKVGDRLPYLEERNEEELSKRILKLSRLNKVRSILKLFKSIETVGLQPNVHACN